LQVVAGDEDLGELRRIEVAPDLFSRLAIREEVGEGRDFEVALPVPLSNPRVRVQLERLVTLATASAGDHASED
jgi:hypothetical protein